MNSNRILYVAPIYKPAIGGGVVYLEMLANYSLSLGFADKFFILTEKFPSSPDVEHEHSGDIEIHRVFPYRAGRVVRTLFSYVAYLIQNIMYLSIPYMLYKKSVNILVIHSSLHNNPNILSFILWITNRFMKGVTCYVDIRDPKLPPHRYGQLGYYDYVLSCSDNITKLLSKHKNIIDKIVQIPIPVNDFLPTSDDIESVKSNYKLNDVKYVFLGSGSSLEKGVNISLNVVEKLRSTGDNVHLVIVGKKRYWDERMTNAQNEGWLIYLGVVPHLDVIQLAVGSWVDLNLSVVDSMPRHSLEVLSAGGRALLPENVPEFSRWCPNCVAKSRDVTVLANQVKEIGGAVDNYCKYPLDEHSVSNVFNKFKSVFNAGVK